MAKTPKVKKRQVSMRSRAARRGEEPQAKTKATATKAPVEETDYKPWLHNAQSAGISKKKKAKPLSRQQKLRQQQALEKAELISAKLDRKVEDSKARSKKVQARAKAWDELNEAAALKKAEKVGKEADAKAEVSKAEQAPAENIPMEDVKLPDLEQPLPIRVAGEESVTGKENVDGQDAEPEDEIT